MQVHLVPPLALLLLPQLYNPSPAEHHVIDGYLDMSKCDAIWRSPNLRGFCPCTWVKDWSIRCCTNYFRISMVMGTDVYPLPWILDTLEWLQRVEFSSFFWTVRKKLVSTCGRCLLHKNWFICGRGFGLVWGLTSFGMYNVLTSGSHVGFVFFGRFKLEFF